VHFSLQGDQRDLFKATKQQEKVEFILPFIWSVYSPSFRSCSWVLKLMYLDSGFLTLTKYLEIRIEFTSIWVKFRILVLC